LLVAKGNLTLGKALLDLRANINIIPLFMLKRIGDVVIQPTRMTLQLNNKKLNIHMG